MDSRLRAVGVGVGVGILGLVVSFVLLTTTALSLNAAGVEITPVLAIVMSLFLTQGLAFMGVGYFYLRRRGIPIRSVGLRVPSLKEAGIAAGAFALSIVYLIVAGFVIQQTGTETADNQIVDLGMSNPEVLLLLIPGSFLLIGPGEELLFRGVVQGRIREEFDAVPGVLIASVVFAAIHLPALSFGAPLSAKLTTLVILMGPSLILGSIYEYTGNLVVPSLVHGSYNALLFVGLYLQATGVGAAAVLS